MRARDHVAHKVRSLADVLTYPIAVAAARWLGLVWLLSVPQTATTPHSLYWALLGYGAITTMLALAYWRSSRTAATRRETHPLVWPALIVIDVAYAVLTAKFYGITPLMFVPALDVAALSPISGVAALVVIDALLIASASHFHFDHMRMLVLQIVALTFGPYAAAFYGLLGLRQAEHQIRAIDQVLNAGSELGAHLSLSDVLAQLNELLGQFRRVVPWDTCIIYVAQYDDAAAEEVLVSAEIAGVEAWSYRGVKIAFGTGVVGHAAAKQRAALIADLQKDPRQPDADQHPRARGCLVVPIVGDGQSVGCVQLIAGEPNAYSPYQLGLIGRLIGLASVGVRNALLHSRTRAMADTDLLTGLLTSRAYHERFELEFRGAQAGRKSLSLLIIDVDNFKRVNDSYGHPAGDELLRRVGLQLRQHARRNDVCCRYGGDEFIVVMPETIKSEAAAVAERIRKTIEDMTLVFGRAVVRATVSIGVASYPQDVTSKQGLIKASDDALYAAKQDGRNSLRVFTPPVAR